MLLGATLALMIVVEDAKPTLQCDRGPVHRPYGGADWAVYSCSDNETVVIVCGPPNPAAPFYFVLHKRDGVYRIEGEGSGDRVASDAAYADLKKLNNSEIVALLEATRRGS